MKNSIDREQILARKRSLEQIATQLKEEFTGIDRVIDQITTTISAWYLFPFAQEKPLIINLWGLTGTGKTSLVKRLAELLDFRNKFLRFDLGDREDYSWSLRKKLEEFFEHENGKPVIIALDEFQYARTLDDGGAERASVKHRMVWDLLDNGKFTINRYTHRLDDIHALMLKLSYCISKGLKGENGVVTEKREMYEPFISDKHRRRRQDEEEEPLFIIPEDLEDVLRDQSKELFESPVLIREYLNTLDEQASLLFLRQVYDLCMSSHDIDCSRSLVFVLGNLDEAYRMCDDFNPDVSANEFHEQSLRITVHHVKKALKARFRNEQIARLGNIHLIYPAFSEEDFKAIITRELRKCAEKIRQVTGIAVVFDASVHGLIYSEGVFPTQGTRPLFTTIDQLIRARTGTIYYETIHAGAEISTVTFSAGNGNLQLAFSDSAGHVIRNYYEKLESGMSKAVESGKDEAQAITAVHEAGHTVLSLALLHTLPEYVYSVTADTDMGGFMYSRNKSRYYSRKQLICKAAVMLGGLLAEKMIFGGDHVTTGAEGDLSGASALICSMIKYSGMGSRLGSFQVASVSTNTSLFDADAGLTREIEVVMKEAESMAWKHLHEEKELLLRIAEYLSENRMIKKDRIREMMLQYARRINTGKVLQDTENFYRDRIRESLRTGNVPGMQVSLPMRDFLLNKNDELHGS